MFMETLSICIQLVVFAAVVREFAFAVLAIILVQQCTEDTQILCFAFVKHRYADHGIVMVRQNKRWYEVECSLFKKGATVTYL